MALPGVDVVYSRPNPNLESNPLEPQVMELPEVDEYIVEADLKAPHLKPDGTKLKPQTSNPKLHSRGVYVVLPIIKPTIAHRSQFWIADRELFQLMPRKTINDDPPLTAVRFPLREQDRSYQLCRLYRCYAGPVGGRDECYERHVTMPGYPSNSFRWLYRSCGQSTLQ